MNETLRKLRIVLRAQLLLGRAQVRHAARGLGLLAVALIFFVFAIAFLDVAAYSALSAQFGDAQAGVVVGLGNLLVGAVLVVLATRQPKETEQTRLAEELGEVALDALSRDIDLARDELRAFSRDVRRLRHTAHLVTSVLGAPWAGLLKLVSESVGVRDDEDEGSDGSDSDA